MTVVIPSCTPFGEACARTALCQLLLAAATKWEVQRVAVVLLDAAGAWGQHLEIPLRCDNSSLEKIKKEIPLPPLDS